MEDWGQEFSPDNNGDIDDIRPKKGMEFDSVEAAWEFWCQYGRKMGFGVRKSYLNLCRKDKVTVTSTRFCCSKAGRRGNDKRDVKEPRPETRTNCLARMGTKLTRATGKYVVHDFVGEHNHELQLSGWVHMKRSQRKSTDARALEAELASDAGPTPIDSFLLLNTRLGGGENIGLMKHEQKNYLPCKRQRDMEFGEVGCLMKYFQTKTLEDPSFFFAVQMDNDEQITNVIWADARMRIDYALFGEALAFDTTFATDKDYRPLGVFVGFNHHRQVVIFGVALLYDETVESFEWLFETFLEAHGSKRPKTIFTDQDAAMEKALEEVIPEVRHGLCTWHLMQNGIKHLGNLMKDKSSFLTDFKKLMYGCLDELQFEDDWKRLLANYDVEGNSWLERTYLLKKKWAKCYMKTAVALGMRSTHLSESLNGVMKKYIKCHLDMTSFFKQFERVVDDIRYNEKQTVYHAIEKVPDLKIRMHPLLQQMGKLYTPAVFKKFQSQWEKSILVRIKFLSQSDTESEYVVTSVDGERHYLVKGNQSEQTVFCSCNKFETWGILCSHALKVLEAMDILQLPQLYIVKRWTRDARDVTCEPSIDEFHKRSHLDVSDRYRELCPDLIKMATIAADFEEGFIFLKKYVNNGLQLLDELRRKHSHGNDNGSDPLSQTPSNVQRNMIVCSNGTVNHMCHGGKSM